MADYEKMYKALFDGISEAIVGIDLRNYGQALNSLVKSLREAEDIYTDSDDTPLALYIKR